MDVHQRIREARARLKMTEDQFARLVGVTRTAVQQWESGATAPSRKRQPVVAQAMGVSVAELMSAGPVGTPAAGRHGEVPLVSRARASAWTRQAALDATEVERWLACPINHGAHTFALRVWGDSMTAPYARSYPAGCIIFVDPELVSPADGERILARQFGRDEVTFKVFKEEDGRRWLQPLNDAHLPIREPFTVVGTVIGKWEDE